MSVDFRPVAKKNVACKCCGTHAALYGVVDFHKNCTLPLELSGIPIYYHRCPNCGFLFTSAFDHFSHEDFIRHIYNPDYIVVDPEYRELRPRTNAQFICNLFPGIKPSSILDYGSGEGQLAGLLLQSGFTNVDSYDPFVPQNAKRPPRRYDCIVSFEVLEHATDPVQTFADMNSFLADDGLILLSTLIQPTDFDQQGLNWWYAGPRNGHVSLFSNTSMLKLIEPFGFRHGRHNDHIHAMYRQIPGFARHLIR